MVCFTDNGFLFIGGQIGWNADQIFETNTFNGQMEQALINIVEIVEKAGGGVQDRNCRLGILKIKEYMNNQKL